jgi:DNA processing protein
MNKEIKFWIGFNLVKGIGPVRLKRILEYFDDIQSAWMAPKFQLQAAGLSEKLSQRIIQLRQQVNLDLLTDELSKTGILAFCWDDPQYPENLRLIHQSPFVVYIKGNLIDQDSWAVAVVGSRRFSPYGQWVTEKVAQTLAQNGITVVSGLARGIDGIAHQTALEAGGRTIAVLGSGINQIYPPEHRYLADMITKAGALISDYAPGTAPEGSNFPPRNRIISALSKTVVITEAGKKSGALITANYAAEQGKEVFAVPGKITSDYSTGANLLIKEGAHPLLDPRDILDTLNIQLIEKQCNMRKSLPGDSREALLYQIIGDEPLHIDEIRNRVNLPIEDVAAALALMELKGLIRKTYGMKYVAIP